jgi:hypothetical protein
MTTTTTLDQIFEKLDWNRKFQQPLTDEPNGRILYVWYEDKPSGVKEAAAILAGLQEEGDGVVRAAYYAQYSRCAALTVVEFAIEDL